jgi:dienelactone hydrolase
MHVRQIGFLVLVAALAACASNQPPAGLLGAYRLEDGRTVSIRRSVDETLRYRLYESGKSGRLYPESEAIFVSGPGFANRDPVELEIRFETGDDGTAQALEWRLHGNAPLSARRIGTERETRFDSAGTSLFARLHLPDTQPPYPAVVLVHGSGDDAGTEWLYNSDFFVANGFAALTYDKRGSGRSNGTFTFDFEQLADDAIAAVSYLKSIPEIDRQRIGLVGYSQGGWVAPLAASKDAAIAFVVVNYGMIESPAEEARLEMRQLLVDAGVTGGDLEEADALIRASISVVASGLESNWEEFEKLKARHRAAYWLEHLGGTPVDKLVSYPRWLAKLVGKRLLPRDLPWAYDSRDILEKSEVPMAWLLAEKDRSAPNKETIAILGDLIDRGKPYSLTVFPDADHGMVIFAQQGSEAVYTGYAADYFQTEVNALKRLSRK